MTAEQAEKYVRERWKSLDVGMSNFTAAQQEKCTGYPECDGDLPGEEHSVRCRAYIEPSHLMLAAAEYTGAHEQKIAEKREEIEAVEQVITDMCDCPGADLEGTIAHLAMKRILAILEAQLAELLRGWREK